MDNQTLDLGNQVEQSTPVGVVPEGSFGNINLKDIHALQNALRGVDERKADFIELLESVRTKGVLNAILVHRSVDPNTGEVSYNLINGAQRTRAAQLAGYETIPARIVEGMSPAQVLSAMVTSNATMVPTKKYEYAKTLTELLKMDNSITLIKLAQMVGKHVEWIKGILTLVDLVPGCGALVDEGKISGANALQLAKLPAEIQDEYRSMAITTPSNEFEQLVKTRLTAIRKEAASQRPANPVFTPKAFLRAIAEIKEVSANVQTLQQIANTAGATDVASSMIAVLNWVLSMDPVTLAEKEAAFNKAQADLKQRKEASTKERQERKAYRDGKQGERSNLELSLSNQGLSDAERKAKLAEFDAAVKEEFEKRWPKKADAETEASN